MPGTRAAATTALTAAALVAFAANSLLCRRALGPRAIDAASFTAVRLAAGAVTLALLARVLAGPRAEASMRDARSPDASVSPLGAGSAAGGLALFAYAALFSFAYLRLHAGIGAFLLFGAVQVTMLGWALRSGERPGAAQLAGLLLALAGLAALTLPGASAPDPGAAAAMLLAGASWGVYSLIGRGARHPLATTAGNFLRSLVPAALLVAAGLAAGGRPHVSRDGVVLAALSGALASGVGYTLWYAVLPRHTRTRAALVQLLTPVLTALGGVALLGERPTARLAAAGAAILAGTALAVAVPAVGLRPAPRAER